MPDLPNDPELQLRQEVDLPCAFCGGKIALGYVLDVHKVEQPCAGHSQPPCGKFIRTELLDFLEQNRLKLGIKVPS